MAIDVDDHRMVATDPVGLMMVVSKADMLELLDAVARSSAADHLRTGLCMVLDAPSDTSDTTLLRLAAKARDAENALGVVLVTLEHTLDTARGKL